MEKINQARSFNKALKTRFNYQNKSEITRSGAPTFRRAGAGLARMLFLATLAPCQFRRTTDPGSKFFTFPTDVRNQLLHPSMVERPPPRIQ